MCHHNRVAMFLQTQPIALLYCSRKDSSSFRAHTKKIRLRQPSVAVARDRQASRPCLHVSSLLFFSSLLMVVLKSVAKAGKVGMNNSR